MEVHRDLIKRAGRGESKAQRELFALFYPYVLAIALRYMGGREEAEEALNDTFLKVFGKLKTFNKEYPMKAWIRKICVNTCIDRIRVIKKKPITVDLGKAAELEAKGELEIFDDCSLLPAIQALPPRYRAVFNLYVFEEYKHREIAEELGISEGTSKSNYARAKQILRKHLGMQGPENHPILIVKSNTA